MLKIVSAVQFPISPPSPPTTHMHERLRSLCLPRYHGQEQRRVRWLIMISVQTLRETDKYYSAFSAFSGSVLG